MALFFIENKKKDNLVFGNVLKIIRDLLTYPHLARRTRNIFFFKSGSIIANPRMFVLEFGKDDYHRENSPLPKFIVQLGLLYDESKISVETKDKLLFVFCLGMLKWIKANNPSIKADFIRNFLNAFINRVNPSAFAEHIFAHKNEFLQPLNASNPMYSAVVNAADDNHLMWFCISLNEPPQRLQLIYAALIRAIIDSKAIEPQIKIDRLRITYASNRAAFEQAAKTIPTANEHRKVVETLLRVQFDNKYKHVFDFLNVQHVHEYTDGERRVSLGAADCSPEGMSVALAALSEKEYFAVEPPVLISMGGDNANAHNLFYFFEAIDENRRSLNGAAIPFICESYHWFTGVVSIEDENISVVIIDSRDFITHFITDDSVPKRFLYNLMKYLRYCLEIDFYVHNTCVQSDYINCSKFALFNLRELARYIASDSVLELCCDELPIKFFLPAQSMNTINKLKKSDEAQTPIKKSGDTFRQHFMPAFKVAGIMAARQKSPVTKKVINTTITTKSTATLHRIIDYIDAHSREQIEAATARHSLVTFLESVDYTPCVANSTAMDDYICMELSKAMRRFERDHATIPDDWYLHLHGELALSVQETVDTGDVKRLRMLPC